MSQLAAWAFTYIWLFGTRKRPVLDYNQLKLRILHFFRGTVEYDSAQVLQLLLEGGVSHKDKAVEMALMRYWRQGLLSRARRSGRFYYRLTERGLARRKWLSKALKPSEA